MRIAILETGRPPARLSHFPSYAAMSADLLGPGYACAAFDVRAGEWPDPAAHEAFLITGSPAGVYDPLPWIADLVAFLRALPPDRKLVGICFGHQVMAEAFGGRAEKASCGWGLGLHAYDITARAPFMDAAAHIAVPVSHQDQVTVPPPGARVLAGSAFTPYGVLEYADRAALSCQCHPEFRPDYARALTRNHGAALRDPALMERALASLEAPHDSARLGGWIRRFLAA
ncbi:type 1 glutamine amidotransferase [Methylobacterium radiodurans]|uniref:GMP synthase n=1 Tax=Methylobacterium radiodurans TaxID=2202828 RepID=A0A2U8VS34_9HYPH|nr:GMP synthase [Methylobacterium radiodurans]AWN36288.1 GMP synthase [Methylobacterium radiodurans]